MSVEKNFSKFGKPFQEKVFQGMLTDSIWSAQMVEVVNPEYFDLKYLGYLFVVLSTNEYDVDKLHHCINFSEESGLSLLQIDKILKTQNPPLSCILDFKSAAENVSETNRDQFFLGRLFACHFKNFTNF